MTTTVEPEALPNPYDDPDFDGVQDPGTPSGGPVGLMAAASTLRLGQDAADWARAQVEHRDSPYGTWYRYCAAFVRLCFNAEYVAEPPRRDAGSIWDIAKRKHRTDDPDSIPGFVPVFWELPSVADHTAFSLPGGWVVSNDILRSGYVDVVRTSLITQKWGGQLLGWAEDYVGNTIWTPPAPPEKPTPNITAYLQAGDYETKVAALRAILRGDNEGAKPVAEKLLAAHRQRERTTESIGALRKQLRAEEVR